MLVVVVVVNVNVSYDDDDDRTAMCWLGCRALAWRSRSPTNRRLLAAAPTTFRPSWTTWTRPVEQLHCRKTCSTTEWSAGFEWSLNGQLLIRCLAVVADRLWPPEHSWPSSASCCPSQR